MIVIWDENKNKTNQKKHGLSFETAKLVFADQNRIELYDSKHSMNEDRFITLGMVGDVLFVVYTQKRNLTRLISARKATRSERRMYYDENCIGK